MSELTKIEPETPSIAPNIQVDPTGDPMRDMAAVAVQRGDVAMLKELKAMIDAEENKQAERQFVSSFAMAQSEFPIIPKRGRGHNNIQYARIEDIMQGVMPVLHKHGLSLNHKTNNSNGIVTVTAILSHEGGHKEVDTLCGPPDDSGKKNAVQAIKSTVTLLKRSTAESLLGLSSHGEDDDAFTSALSQSSIETMKLIENTNTHKGLSEIKAKLMTDTDTNKDELIALKKAWAAQNEVIHNRLGEAV